MLHVQERVSRVEGRVEEHARMLTNVPEAVRHLEVRMDQRLDGVERRIDGVEKKMDNHFRWLVGIVLSAVIALVAAG